ncbi:MAG TPA: GNAT family N-acetyltransferase [Bacteroidetes bacterium]|nr:GNAT family N-acetyltransferase [Bacteroidota bacterium]
MEILHDAGNPKGRFYIQQDGETLAEMTYVWAGDNRIIIDHTEVDDRLRGKGAGKQLVQAGVDFARDKKISILPLCPFAKSVFQRVPEIRDVLS